MQKIFYQKILSLLFLGFIMLTMLFSFVFNWRDMIDTLYESKDKLFSSNTYSSVTKELVSVTDNAFDNGIFLRTKYIDLYGGLQNACHKKIIWESDTRAIAKGSDNKLYSTGNLMLNMPSNGTSSKQIDRYGEAVKDLGKYVKDKDADLVFFLAPARYDAEEVKLPIPVEDNAKENVEYMFSILKDDENLTVLDSQQLYKNQNKEFGELFFKTDHHWNIKTAFWGYSEICKSINKNYGYNIKPFYFDMDSYTVETLTDSYLGSYGARVGGGFVGYDDFDVIYPKFETEYEKSTSKIYNKSIDEGGAIKTKGIYTDVIINMPYINNKYNKLAYSVYIGSDVREVIINNYKSATQKKILIIKDSFALPVAAFLSTCFEEMRIIDLRYMKDMSAYEYIDSYDPDLVLLLYSPNAYSDLFFDFDGSNSN